MSSEAELAKILSGPKASAVTSLRTLLSRYVSSGNTASFSSAFAYFTDQHSSPAVLGEVISPIVSQITSLPDPDQTVTFLLGVIAYVRALPSMSAELGRITPSFVAACNSAGRYGDLARFYEARPFDRDTATPNELIVYYCELGLAKLNARARSQALTCLTQAYQGLFSVTTPKPLQEQYGSLRALIAVDGAEFLSAAQEYFSLATIVVPDKVDYLRLAMVYGILAPASQGRDRLFRQLAQDERSRTFPVAVFVERLAEHQLVEAAEVAQIAQQIKGERGFSMEALRNGMQAHNLRALANYFAIVGLDMLARLLGVTSEELIPQIESMISSGVLHAVIDQPAGILYFKEKTSEAQRRDRSIEVFAQNVRELAEEIRHAG